LPDQTPLVPQGLEEFEEDSSSYAQNHLPHLHCCLPNNNRIITSCQANITQDAISGLSSKDQGELSLCLFGSVNIILSVSVGSAHRSSPDHTYQNTKEHERRISDLESASEIPFCKIDKTLSK
jgi:hypothetical protein